MFSTTCTVNKRQENAHPSVKTLGSVPDTDANEEFLHSGDAGRNTKETEGKGCRSKTALFSKAQQRRQSL